MGKGHIKKENCQIFDQIQTAFYILTSYEYSEFYLITKLKMISFYFEVCTLNFLSEGSPMWTYWIEKGMKFRFIWYVQILKKKHLMLKLFSEHILRHLSMS